MKIRIKTNIKFNGERIEAGTIFTSPLPEGMEDSEFLNNSKVVEFLEVGDSPEPAVSIGKPAKHKILKKS